jgi:hypothetical protein
LALYGVPSLTSKITPRDADGKLQVIIDRQQGGTWDDSKIIQDLQALMLARTLGSYRPHTVDASTALKKSPGNRELLAAMGFDGKEEIWRKKEGRKKLERGLLLTVSGLAVKAPSFGPCQHTGTLEAPNYGAQRPHPNFLSALLAFLPLPRSTDQLCLKCCHISSTNVVF